MPRWSARRWAVIGWTIGVWVVGIAGAMYAGWSNCSQIVDPAVRDACASGSGADVTGMTIGLAVFPLWILGLLTIWLGTTLVPRVWRYFGSLGPPR